MPIAQDVDIQLPTITEDEFSEEKWLPPKKRKPKQTGTYKKKYTSFRHIGMNSKSKCPVIGVLKNGHVGELRAVNVENESYTFLNTCTFDSLLQLICIAYTDSVLYSNFVDGLKK